MCMNPQIAPKRLCSQYPDASSVRILKVLLSGSGATALLSTYLAHFSSTVEPRAWCNVTDAQKLSKSNAKSKCHGGCKAKRPANQQSTTMKNGAVAGIACRMGNIGLPVLSKPFSEFRTLAHRLFYILPGVRC